MQNRLLTAVVVVLCLGAAAVAQGPAKITGERFVKGASGESTVTGNVVVEVNGVVVRADRAVIRNGEVTLDGNVRMTLPKSAYTATTMRDRIWTTPAAAPTPARLRLGRQQIDPPMPKPWEPAQR